MNISVVRQHFRDSSVLSTVISNLSEDPACSLPIIKQITALKITLFRKKWGD